MRLGLPGPSRAISGPLATIEFSAATPPNPRTASATPATLAATATPTASSLPIVAPAPTSGTLGTVTGRQGTTLALGPFANSALKNPYFRESVEQTKALLYAA